MTCEISIVNPPAIALAADSATTVRHWGIVKDELYKVGRYDIVRANAALDESVASAPDTAAKRKTIRGCFERSTLT
jgi:hypothetical protein